jgi:hypothetical protein
MEHFWMVSKKLEVTQKFPASEAFNTRHSFILKLLQILLQNIVKTSSYIILWLELNYAIMS